MSERPERPYRVRYHARLVLPVASPPVEDGTVVVEHDRITYVGPRAGAPLARDVELGDAVITPGLVNAHTHLDLTVMRGLLDELPFFEWIRWLVAARDRLTAHELLDSARLGVTEGLEAGITTYADTAPGDAPFRAMLEMGVRGIAYREVFGPDPARWRGALSELKRAVAAMRENETPLVSVGVSPHAPYSVSDALYREVAVFARSAGIPIATHIAEGEDESRLVSRGEGAFADFLRGRGLAVAPRARTPVQLLASCDLLGRDTLLIHCVRVDADDIAGIAASGCGVATCPVSNLRLAGARAPVRELLAAGVPVGVGTDSMASNDGMNVWRESLLAMGADSALLADAGHGAARALARREVPTLELATLELATLELATPELATLKLATLELAALELATLGGARALRLDERIGSLEPGKQADLAVFPLSAGALRPGVRGDVQALAGSDRAARAPFVPAPLVREPLMRASLVLVAGRILVRDGRVIGGDPGVRERVMAAAARIA